MSPRPLAVILSAAKDLSRAGRRSFATLRMTAVLKFTPLGLVPALVNARLMQKSDAHP